MAKIKLDSKNYRVHSDKNKMIIDKSLKELGVGPINFINLTTIKQRE